MSLNRFELDDVSDLKIIAQLALTSSKLTIETLEKGVKYVQVNNKNTRTTSLLLTLNIFHTFF